MDVWNLKEVIKNISDNYKVKFFEYGESEYDRCKMQNLSVGVVNVTTVIDDGDLAFIKRSDDIALTLGELRSFISSKGLDGMDVIFIDKSCYVDIHNFRVDKDKEELIFM